MTRRHSYVVPKSCSPAKKHSPKTGSPAEEKSEKVGDDMFSSPEAIAAARKRMVNGPYNMAPSRIIAPDENMVEAVHEVDFFVEPGVTCRLGKMTCIVTDQRPDGVWNSRGAPRGSILHDQLRSMESRKPAIIDMLLEADLDVHFVAENLTKESIDQGNEDFVALLWQVRRFLYQLMADSEQLFTA